MLPVIAVSAGIHIAHFYYFTLPDLAVPAVSAALVLCLAFGLRGARRMRIPSACTAILLSGIAAQVIHRQGRRRV